MKNYLLIALAVIGVVLLTLRTLKSQETPAAGNGPGDSMANPSQPVTPDIRPVSRIEDSITATPDPVGSIGGGHSGITSPDIQLK